MSSAKKAWKSEMVRAKRRRMWLALWLLLAACAPATPAAPQATPTGPLLPRQQAIQLGLEICGKGRITSSTEPALDVAELTTNQAIAARLGRPTWADLPADSPVWLVKFKGAFSLARPPAGSSAASPAPGPFPACWAIIEARTGARGTVYIPEN
jgi:hypothetical protein